MHAVSAGTAAVSIVVQVCDTFESRCLSLCLPDPLTTCCRGLSGPSLPHFLCILGKRAACSRGLALPLLLFPTAQRRERERGIGKSTAHVQKGRSVDHVARGTQLVKFSRQTSFMTGLLNANSEAVALRFHTFCSIHNANKRPLPEWLPIESWRMLGSGRL